MGEIDPRLSGPLCRALDVVLTRELGLSVNCADVSGKGLPWDIVGQDPQWHCVAKISHTRAMWRDCVEAGAECEVIRLRLEEALRLAGRSDVLIVINTHDNPVGKQRQRRFGASLGNHALTALDKLGEGESADVLDALEREENPEWLSLRCALNVFKVTRHSSDEGPHVMVRSDRMDRFEPTATSGILERVTRKSSDQAKDAPGLTLLVEVEGASLTADVVREIQGALTQARPPFLAVYVTTRDHGQTYRVARVA